MQRRQRPNKLKPACPWLHGALPLCLTFHLPCFLDEAAPRECRIFRERPMQGGPWTASTIIHSSETR